MRLELESKPAGVSLKDRWREVASLYQDHIEAADTMLFYDFHSLLACLYGDQVLKLFLFRYDWTNKLEQLSLATLFCFTLFPFYGRKRFSR
jgi:hypothetical protein